MPKITMTYYTERMKAYGITEAQNSVKIWRNNIENGKNELQDFPIFLEHEKGIEIMPYTLDRHHHLFAKDGSRWKNKFYSIIRLFPEVVKPNGDVQKYLMPKGQGTPPLIPPALLDAYEEKKQIPTLYITEGYFKAFKAELCGLWCIGLVSITCMIDKSTGKLHQDILKIIEVCKVQRVVWLTDNDCRSITTKEINADVDLYKRVFGFYNSISRFYDLMSANEDVKIYFAHINEDLESKGLDDLLIAEPKNHKKIIGEANQFDVINNGRYEGNYFTKFNITYGVSKVRSYFLLNDVTQFYLHHVEKRIDLKGKKFRYNGTLYSYNDEKGICNIEIPKDAADYFRVGDNYYEYIKIPNRYNELTSTFHGRLKSTIKDDHKAEIFQFIPKYKAFCSVPDHTNYQRVIDNCFNTYHPFLHQPEEGDFSLTLDFVKHIFGEKEIILSDGKIVKNYELGLDYLTLLYKKPQLILPILCLVSKERNTGKTTFSKWLKIIFGENKAVVGNQDFENGFNAHWTTKLIVCVDETKIDKLAVVEKIKSLSTSNNTMMNAKGKDQVEIETFMKFILLSNNEDNFINIDSEEVRFWVNKVPTIPKEKLAMNLEVEMMEEIPAFLYHLNVRKMATKNEFRHWFNPEYLKTDALLQIQNNSAPTLWKILRGKLTTMFEDFDIEEIDIPKNDIKEYLLKGYKFEDDYIKKVLTDRGYKLGIAKRSSFPMWINQSGDEKNTLEKKVQLIKFHNRCYTFKRQDFTDEKISASQTSIFDNSTEQKATIEMSGDVNDDLPF